MLEGLSAKLQDIFQRLRGKGKLNEADVDAAMREVRIALLEADVNFRVVKDFVNKVKERSVGQEVLQSLTPGQQVIKIVHEELTAMMGGQQSKLALQKSPSTIMMVGLQGSGKTTTSGKLANYLRKQGRQPLLVAADVYRPAAREQLQVLGRQLDIPVYTDTVNDAVRIARQAAQEAQRLGRDVIILDTAGRLHIDDELMAELDSMKELLQPDEILLVVDAMTGQDAVNVAESFNEQLQVTGVVLTKLDGDTRGGAALSIRAVTGKPIKFVGVGEKLDALEPFYPDRLASRILGMGDILSLIEKAQQQFDQEQAEKLQEKLRKQEFTLEDFLEQMQQVKKLGSLEQILAMLPGVGAMKQLKQLKVDEKQFAQIGAIIQSMTIEERQRPEIINGSRRKRIAQGSGTRVQDVNRLLKEFEQMRKMMKSFGKLGKGKKGLAGLRLPF